MLYYRLYILIFLITYSFDVIAQNSVSIFILDSSNKVDSSIVFEVYTKVGFIPSITVSEINTSLNTSNFDIAFVAEGYVYDSSENDFVGDFLNQNEQQIIQNFIEQGGHVIWISENWVNYPVSLLAYQTINNIYETNISEGPFFNNGGMGSPNIFRIHPSMGPAGLSLEETVHTSGSYGTILDVPSCHKLYAPDITDNTNTFNKCTHTTLAVFPARPKPNKGSIIISTELGLPFKGFTVWGGVITYEIYNTVLDSSIAQLHYQLIVEENSNELNNWSDTYDNMNPGCPASVASFSLSDTIACVGDTIFFTHNYTGEVSFYTNDNYGKKRVVIRYFEINGSCDDDTVVILNYIKPIVDAGQNTTICKNDETVLSAYNPYDATISWNNGVTDNVPFSPQETNKYIVESSLYECTNSDSVIVYVIEKPKIQFNVDQKFNACEGDEIVLNATTDTISNIVWNNGVENNVAFLADSSFVFYVNANIGNCNSSDSVIMNVTKLPDVDVGNNQELCFGERAHLNAVVKPITSIVSWDNGLINDSYFYPNKTNTYTLTANNNNCISKDSLIITVNTLPRPNFEVDINYHSDYINTYYFQNTTSEGEIENCLWNFGDQTQSDEISPTHNYDSRQINFANVTLYINDKNGCLDSISKRFKIHQNLKDSVFVPSAFTPNGDQDNELFVPIYNILPSQYEFSIFSQWGQRIFKSTDPKLGWNGKFNNELVQNGIYTYKLLFNKKSLTGTFTVIGEK